jgi:nicotinamidase-related amidase
MAPQTALLVIDMQNFFESMTRAALPNIQRLISHFQSTSSTIIFTLHGHTEEELTVDPSPNQLVRKWGPDQSVAIGSEDWQFQQPLKQCTTQPGSTVVAKNTYDAFINTSLTTVLEDKAVERILVCGVMTDCCCDTTARSAFNRGYETWLISDACATASRSQHQAALKGFSFGYGPVITTQDALRSLKHTT